MLSYSCSSMIPISCDGCKKNFQRIQKRVKHDYKHKSSLKHFCSNKCQASLIKKELVKLNCANCNIQFLIKERDFKKRSKNLSNLYYCSHKCANKSNIHSEETKKKISVSIQNKYKEKLKNAKYKIKSKNGYKIANLRNICINCSKEFYHYKRQKTCSNDCYLNIMKKAGKKGGTKTASLELHKRNRSSNEKMFFVKIKEIYNDALSNKRIFNGWDADIIIPSKQIAIHWNGIWHYKPVLGEALLDKIKRKDKLRYEAIEQCGYKNYIIQDLGGKNEEKVKKEYIDFINYINS